MSRLALMLALFASACASGQPAPISYGGGGASAQPPQRQRAPIVIARDQQSQAPEAITEEAPPQPSRERPRQAAPNWADGQGRPLSDYALQPDEVQPYDPAALPASHRVTGEETLFDVATRYQVPLRALIDQNQLEPPYTLSSGRELQLPPPRLHTVRRGESFEDVARAYNVDLRSLALLNRMQPPYRVDAGDRVVLPALARVRPPAPPPGPPPTVTPNARFQMPLRGEVLSRFGAQPGGQRIDGIEIAGREGDRIVASADGDVVYAGDDLPGYGTLVLIRHADNYVTAYGYNARALVRESQRVRAGEPIAELGPRPQGRARLLFQVRQASTAVDPAPLLGIAN